jgi:hypothetical protein
VTTLTDPVSIALARMAALRGALKIEVNTGMTRKGRSASVIARQELINSIGPDPRWIRSKRGALIVYDAFYTALRDKYFPPSTDSTTTPYKPAPSEDLIRSAPGGDRILTPMENNHWHQVYLWCADPANEVELLPSTPSAPDHGA